MDKILPIKPATLTALQNAINSGSPNFRPVQPLNNRMVYHLTGLCNQRNIQINPQVIRLSGSNIMISLTMMAAILLALFL